jgi:hypothetical protein
MMTGQLGTILEMDLELESFLFACGSWLCDRTHFCKCESNEHFRMEHESVMSCRLDPASYERIVTAYKASSTISETEVFAS